MIIIRDVNEMQAYRQKLCGKQIGFVPTMGAFHEGHLSLMETAKLENDFVITSIFVNPLQFGPNEDYDTYPRNEEQDIQMAEKTGVDLIFIPTIETMYPNEMSISMEPVKRGNVLCGRTRPGHFNGVLTVLTKLFHMTVPNRTYFGMKDAQQLAIVDALITDFNFPIQLRGVQTVRESDGLAKSSRNIFLSKEERKESVYLYQALKAGQKLVVDGENNPAIIVNEVEQIIKHNTSGIIDYVELLSYPKLENVSIINQPVILAVAVRFKNTRLIDNVIFHHNGDIYTV